MNRIGWAIAGITLAASGGYVFVYLYRWEWNRALMSSALFLAAEIALVAMILARRMSAIERRLDGRARDGRDRILERLRESTPPPRTGFAWLARPDQLNVFVPVLLGAGVVLSALAWVVERLARAVGRPVAERALATRLAGLQLPDRGFLETRDDPFAMLRGPTVGKAS
jgi:hypothetical protein